MEEMLVLTERNFSRLKDLVKKNLGKYIIFSSDDDSLNRKVIEKLPVKVILIPLSGRKDYFKQRNSGFNEVMARIASKNGVKVGVSLDELIFSKDKERIISRLKQTIKLCAKSKVQVVFVLGKEKRDKVVLRSLGLTLGMPTWMTKDCFI